MIERAIAIAREAHQGQLDKAGHPYIEHPLRVMSACADDPLAAMAAVLHDVAEDCPEWPLERLSAEGIPEPVIEVLGLLCHDKSISYFEYVDSIKVNSIAKTVKLADLADNMNLSRLPSPGPPDYRRIARYRAAKKILMA